MPNYVALIYSPDVDWSRPEYSDEMAAYGEFGQAAVNVIRGGAVLYQTNTATTVRVTGGKGGDVVLSDGPYAETKEALTGFYLLECADLDEAIKVASMIPAAWNGAVEVRPVLLMEAPTPDSVEARRAEARASSVTT
ncbi:YciI family protein [Cryobacterium sp. PH31-L1]|uniref:YciI family protein n=1 Tax=Cryobacterium sp. PH31-L1 TaxID=3046199 RepID=UPI0024BA2C6E|nr:YciI family protein [Cryobacterium sp. PH31-L1]MDJ0377245.1 YciI family protein [Cryobacterium sp. PH31-L1]